MRIKVDIACKPITFVRCDMRRSVFAPSPDLLHEYKAGGMTWDEYVDRYKNEMRAAYQADPTPFIEMARMLDNVEFVCWCNTKRRQDDRCHRFLLRAILVKVRDSLSQGVLKG
jgi:uncharacterized protein YeaO (DUF488 family)